MTGMDQIEDRLFTLHRGYNPLSGNRILIEEWRSGEGREIGLITKPLTVDNFEGIAATRLLDGTLRLYLISDDNFSDRQQTLLFALDLSEGD